MTVFDASTNVRACVTGRAQPGDDSGLRSLAQAVVTAARDVNERILAPVGGPNGNLAFEPRTLLAVLTFCYVRQIYGSAEVAARLREDENLHRLCGDEIPDATTLCRFCSGNRAALNWCLKAALRALAEEKIAEGLLTRVNEERLAEEASRRITMAMFTDSMELDKDPAGVPVDLCLAVAN